MSIRRIEKKLRAWNRYAERVGRVYPAHLVLINRHITRKPVVLEDVVWNWDEVEA